MYSWFAYLFILITVPCFASNLVDEMTLEEKVGQIMMVHFHGESANEESRTLIQELNVGSVIYYNWANGLGSPQQVRALSSGLQQQASETRLSIPLIIAVDQEGGVVARIQGVTVFPGNKALGMTGDPQLAELSAFIIGQELLSVGVNLNLAPVVDVNNNPRNPVIGIRSFAETPDTVLSYAEMALRGYQRAGIMTSLKHFPGHGDVEIDSHEDLPVIKKSREELNQMELVPFAGLAAQSDSVMTAHILVPSLDPENCSTLSKPTLDLLRNEIGYEGVILSDSLTMGGVLKNCHDSIDEVAVKAFNAGCDILMFGGKQLTGHYAEHEITLEDLRRLRTVLADAVRNSQISEARLNESVQRILNLKTKKREAALLNAWNSIENQQVAKKIASQALKIENRGFEMGDLSSKNIYVIAPQLLRDSIYQTSLLSLSHKSSVLFFNSLNPPATEVQVAREMAKNSDIVIFCAYNAWKNPQQAALIQSFLDDRKPLILLVLRDPLDGALFPRAKLVYSTYSPTFPSIQAVCEAIRGNL